MRRHEIRAKRRNVKTDVSRPTFDVITRGIKQKRGLINGALNIIFVSAASKNWGRYNTRLIRVFADRMRDN